jgi:hypothetical protein
VALGGSSGRREKWHGKRGEARREEARAALELGATRGCEGQQEVARGGRKRRAVVLQQRSGGADQGCQRKKKERRGPRDWFAKIEKSRHLTVNRNFPLIQKPNVKMMKIEVVEFFKPYNISLGLKFKNPKYKALF